MQKNWKVGLLFILPALSFYLLFLILPWARNCRESLIARR